MRVKPGSTLDEVVAELDTTQAQALDRVLVARDAMHHAEHALASSSTTVKIQVAEAIAAGVPVTVLSRRLGISRHRVYQMRNDVARTGI